MTSSGSLARAADRVTCRLPRPLPRRSICLPGAPFAASTSMPPAGYSDSAPGAGAAATAGPVGLVMVGVPPGGPGAGGAEFGFGAAVVAAGLLAGGRVFMAAADAPAAPDDGAAGEVA